MKQELTDKLLHKYHDMFHKDARGEGKPTLRFIECGDGWYDIIERLCEDIYAMRPKVMQIKEKFGGLRFYASFNSDYTDQGWKRIKQAESEASEICEECGQPGQARVVKGWRSTQCDKCYEIYLQRMEKK